MHGGWCLFHPSIRYPLVTDVTYFCLHSPQERILGDISYSAPEKVEEARKAGQERYQYVVDEAKVMEVMQPILKKQDLSKYIL